MVYCIIILCIFIADQMTKSLAERKIPRGNRIEVLKDKLYFTNVRNRGAAYGLLQERPKALMALTVTSVLYMFRWLYLLLVEKGKVVEKLAVAFTLGGALGNLFNRANKKYVTDFIHIPFKNSPIFNVADLFVLLGSLLMLLASFVKCKKPTK